MFEINNNTHQLWQWSTDQRLIVKNEYCGEVHFCNIDSASPIVRHVYDEDDCRFVDVPDELLTVSKTIKAYAYNFGGEFLGEQVFIVYPRPMPENYNATEADARGSALFSCRPETEGHIVIGEDRAVSVPEALRCIAVEHDHNIETVTFDCPRYWDGHDFSEMHVYINYRCANGKLGQYPCKTVTIDEADETIIHFDWTISRNLSCSKGVVSFLVCVKKTLDDGSVENHWSSRINQEMEVLEGLECPAEEIADYPDVIEQILLRLDDIEKNGGSGGGSSVEVDTTLSQSGKAADAKTVGEKFEQLSEAKADKSEIPVVAKWALAELPFTESEISDTVTGAGFVVNPTNFADGKMYFRYHAGATSFKWTNPNPQKGSLTITMRVYMQYATSGRTKIVTEYSDGTNNSLIDIMYINHGETVTYITDPDKTVVSIRGNYDAENWVLIDMSALSIVADYPAPTGTVKTVNGVEPDENGNVEIAIPEGGGGTSVEIDSTLTQASKAADAKVVGDKLGEVSKAIAELGGTLIEPAEDDIPKVFFGGALQQTKDEAVVPFRYISKTEDISGYAEIKAQGNSTMRFPKKNQTVKMYKDADCTEKLKVDFKGWGKQNKHCYKANWIDLSQARNVVSARIWGDIIKTRANYAELPELMRTSPNLGVIDGFPVKVYADGVYQGRYTLNIPKDKWMANMDDELDTHCILCGEDGNPALFRASWVSNGSGWSDEIHDAVPNSIMTRWNEIIDFVQNSTNEEFKANLDNYIDVQSLLDYHLFGLAMCGMDGYAKNQLFMTWDGIKWYAQVYDMDATWGLSWNAYFVATDYPRSSYEDMGGGGNLLYIRLEEVFWNELKERWAELKSDALSIENIINRFERFTDIMPEELVKEDYAATTADGAFTAIPLQGKNNVQQIRTYALARQKWVDEYLYRVAATSITLSQSTLVFTNETPATLVATVEPSDTTDSVVWTSTDENVAIVDGGEVTPLHDGSCVIRATAGIVSASCAVTVSGIETQYSVTNNLFGVTNSNTSATVTEGASYEATLTAKDGYTLEGASITVTMGDVDITSTAYSDGVITITNVTGNIVIAVSAVDTNVAYSLGETVFDGTQTSIDTGIMLQDEPKDYTVFIDVEPGVAESASEYTLINAENSTSPWPGWRVSGNNYTAPGSVSSNMTFENVKLLKWGDADRRIKLAVRFSDGVMQYVTNGKTALTEIANGDYTTSFSKTVRIAGKPFVGTIYSCKIWLEAKTDEECLSMVNS